jgi:hypothetical protein
MPRSIRSAPTPTVRSNGRWRTTGEDWRRGEYPRRSRVHTRGKPRVGTASRRHTRVDPRTDHPDVLVSFRVGDHDQASSVGGPKKQPALFILRVVWVTDDDGERIAERGRGLWKGNAVLREVRRGFRWVVSRPRLPRSAAHAAAALEERATDAGAARTIGASFWPSARSGVRPLRTCESPVQVCRGEGQPN